MEILIQDIQKKIPIRAQRIKRAIQTILSKKGIRLCQLSVVFVTPAKMRAINQRYLQHSYTTDVLTFDYLSSVETRQCLVSTLDAEIVIAPSVAHQNAVLYQTSTEHEIILYVIHGVLHLLGFDDHSPREIVKMRREEKRLMQAIFKKM